ncbi:sn-glycerol-3-phosphate import ATP-binding protein UgpC [Pontiella desulfatans]|uniref:sn-glycerol-3-phosphate import ATP-binding protein UgpC n=1 Tax=Pontiella desulfatans TaxID=2750659 RepID=A0A6C2UBY6_PONDE|nr:sn-glycerol-3-phosphate ABC transporter ATP-binding protein UgpC [Pontiella desulfatans]VGO17610.1 sn-glycerol-3-phosphate import ATP-binding protein UgpC [Pontiella desulfatans]
MSKVSLKNVYKIYADDVAVVNDFNLEIEDGEFLVLVGPSGCGKSTTLRMVAGLEEISKGDVRIGNRLVNDVPPKDRDIAMVFQNYALYPHMSVRDNMAFGLKLRKIKKNEINRRVEEAARILGLEDYLHRKPKALSGGQRQRVAMGRAIVREPAVFLFDEPLSNLDAKMRVEMRKEILQLHKRVATTMIYVTHDQIEAMTLGDRICIMRDGVIEQVGRPTAVFDSPASLFVARFIGTPPMNILAGVLVEEGGRIWFDGQTVRAPVAERQYGQVRGHLGKQVCLGLRPKAFWTAADRPDAETFFTGDVEVSELLGEETLVHLTSGEHRFTVSLDPHHTSSLGDAFTVVPDMERAHIFDAETEQNLTMTHS